MEALSILLGAKSAPRNGNFHLEFPSQAGDFRLVVLASVPLWGIFSKISLFLGAEIPSQFSCIMFFKQSVNAHMEYFHPSKDALSKRGIILSLQELLCPFCGKDPESIIHLFFTCFNLMGIWNAIFNWLRFPYIAHSILSLTSNILVSFSKGKNGESEIHYMVCCDLIYLAPEKPHRLSRSLFQSR